MYNELSLLAMPRRRWSPAPCFAAGRGCRGHSRNRSLLETWLVASFGRSSYLQRTIEVRPNPTCYVGNDRALGAQLLWQLVVATGWNIVAVRKNSACPKRRCVKGFSFSLLNGSRNLHVTTTSLCLLTCQLTQLPLLIVITASCCNHTPALLVLLLNFDVLLEQQSRPKE